MLAKERRKLLSELESAIDNLFELQDDITDKIEKNTLIVEEKIATIDINCEEGKAKIL